MQHAGDRLILVVSILQHEAGDAEQVGDVGGGRPLADLLPVDPERVGRGVAQPLPCQGRNIVHLTTTRQDMVRRHLREWECSVGIIRLVVPRLVGCHGINQTSDADGAPGRLLILPGGLHPDAGTSCPRPPG